MQLEDGTIIYIQAVENVNTPAIASPAEDDDDEESLLISKGTSQPTQPQNIPQFQQIDKTIKAYTNYALKAFKEVATANVDKVTLEFGINIGGSTGIPFVTQGTVESNLKITVECTFPPKKNNS